MVSSANSIHEKFEAIEELERGLEMIKADGPDAELQQIGLNMIQKIGDTKASYMKEAAKEEAFNAHN